jgi:hypothetical protein
MYAWNRRWIEYEANGMAGEPLKHVASDGFLKHRVGLGDNIYVVVERDRRAYLVGRLPVSRIVDQSTAERLMNDDLIKRRDHALANAPDSVVSFTRLIPEDVARELESERGARLRFEPGQGYTLSRQALRAARWLKPDSAQLLDAILDADDSTSIVASRRSPLRQAAKQAVELRAMAVATNAYTDEGWDVEDVSTHESYDLLCTRPGDERHVEGKGTTGEGVAVGLTANEVIHARDVQPNAALAIVHGIALRDPLDTPVASGGTLRRWDPWIVDDGDLVVTAYRYEPPT